MPWSASTHERQRRNFPLSDSEFLDIETVEGQAALFSQARDAIDAIGTVAASSPDDLVQVWVTVSGTVADVVLDDATVRLDRDELARLITATAQQAAQNASREFAAALAELERRREELLDRLQEADPEIATALRSSASSARVPTAPTHDPFDYYQPTTDVTPQDDW